MRLEGQRPGNSFLTLRLMDERPARWASGNNLSDSLPGLKRPGWVNDWPVGPQERYVADYPRLLARDNRQDSTCCPDFRTKGPAIHPAQSLWTGFAGFTFLHAT